MTQKKIAIVFGGVSPEHEVSLSSAMEVINNIDTNLYEVLPVGISKQGIWYVGEGAWDLLFSQANRKNFPANLINYTKPIKTFSGKTTNSKLPSAEFFAGVSAAFPLTHGDFGEDGRIQSIFELLGIPIVGCGSLSSAICMSKSVTKAVLTAAGVPVTKGLSISRLDFNKSENECLSRINDYFADSDLFIKPEASGSSFGVSKVLKKEQIIPAIKLALEFSEAALVEEYIDNRELMVAVMGPDKNGKLITSPVGEVVPSQEVYDYADKYQLGTEVQVCPAEVSPQVAAEIQRIVDLGYRALHCQGLSRVDCFLDKKNGRIMINEVNTIPGFTGMSHFPKFMKVAGFPIKELISKLIELSL